MNVELIDSVVDVRRAPNECNPSPFQIPGLQVLSVNRNSQSGL